MITCRQTKRETFEKIKTTITMKQLVFIVFLVFAGLQYSFAQVANEVNVFVRPGTEVHVFENMTNTNSGNFTVGDEGLLYVDGTLVNDGSMTFNNASSLMRGSTGSDGTGSGTYYVKRQGTNSISVFNYWSSPMVSYSGVPGYNGYRYDPNTGTLDFSDDQPADPGWVSHGGAMTAGSGYASQNGGLHTFMGDVNNGNVDVPLVYYPFIPGNTNPGTPFNLVGNPYPSAVSCASLVAGNPDINGSIYFWDDDLTGGSGYSSSDYAVWNGTGSLGTGSGSAGAPNGTISTGQGFKIRALNAGAVLNFTNTMRVLNTTQFFRPNGDNSRMWFSLEGNNRFNQILIGVLVDATDDEDRLYDAVKFRGNTDIALSAQNGDRDYAILAFPPPHSEKSVPLSVFVSEAGNYTFRPDIMENFEWQNVYFVDTKTSQYVELYEGLEIPKYLEAGVYEDRFYLNFYPDGFVGVAENPDDEIFMYSNDHTIYINTNTDGRTIGNLNLLGLDGKLIFSKPGLVLPASSTTQVQIPSVATGIYIVQLETEEELVHQKIQIQ